MNSQKTGWFASLKEKQFDFFIANNKSINLRMQSVNVYKVAKGVACHCWNADKTRIFIFNHLIILCRNCFSYSFIQSDLHLWKLLSSQIWRLEINSHIVRSMNSRISFMNSTTFPLLRWTGIPISIEFFLVLRIVMPTCGIMKMAHGFPPSLFWRLNVQLFAANGLLMVALLLWAQARRNVFYESHNSTSSYLYI